MIRDGAPELDVASCVPHAIATLGQYQAGSAATFAGPTGLQRIVAELEVVDVVRTDARLDYVHVHVLRDISRRIRARANGVEAITALRVGARPALERPVAIARGRIQAADVR